MEEIWKIIENSNGKYSVSNFGRVYSNINKRLLNPSNSRGYLNIGIVQNNKRLSIGIHRLVAQAFIPNPENKREVNHINGDKSNNIVSNLEWVTPKENMTHSRRTGLNKGHKKNLPSLAKKVLCIDTGIIYKSAGQAGKELGVNRCAICHQIARGGKCKGKKFVYLS